MKIKCFIFNPIRLHVSVHVVFCNKHGSAQCDVRPPLCYTGCDAFVLMYT